MKVIRQYSRLKSGILSEKIKRLLQEGKLRADLYHLTMPSQYLDTVGANRLPPLRIPLEQEIMRDPDSYPSRINYHPWRSAYLSIELVGSPYAKESTNGASYQRSGN